MQKGRRAVIGKIDHRTREMEKNFGLVTLERDAFEQLESPVGSRFETE
jgi:hypothetical protein